jgi:peptidoglycan/LPS O-acetylase OafA/YrhL
MAHGRIAIVEAMRGIAAASVALFHFSVQFEGPVRDLFAYGWLGVDVFFVISGFVIPLSLHGRDYSVRQFPQFMTRRLMRLEPPYLVSIVLVLAVWHLSASLPGSDGLAPNYSWAQLASHLLYAVPLTQNEWISPVYWSLAYEFVFYVVTGLTFASLINRPVEWTVLLAAAIAALLYRKEAAFDVCILEFLVGIIVMRIATGEGRPARLWFWLLAALTVVFFASGPWVSGAVALAAAAILLLRKRQLGRWAYVTGSLSYSLYLTHTSTGMHVVNAWKHLASGTGLQVALMMIGLAIAVGFAFLFSLAVERPAMRASRQIAMTPKAA